MPTASSAVVVDDEEDPPPDAVCPPRATVHVASGAPASAVDW